MASDVYHCPHEGCRWRDVAECNPHTEVIGDENEEVGAHCWEEHRCVEHHPESFTHVGSESPEGDALEVADAGLRVILAMPEDLSLQDAKMVAMSALLREELPE